MLRAVACASAALACAGAAAPQESGVDLQRSADVNQFTDSNKTAFGDSSGAGQEGGHKGATILRSYGSGGGDWQKYVPGSNSSSARGGDWDKYVPGRNGSWHKYVPGSNGSSAGGFDYKKYTNYSHWEDKYKKDESFQTAPQDPTKCHNMSSLKAWRQGQMDIISKYGKYAPKDAVVPWKAYVNRTFDENKHRIEEELANETNASSEAAESDQADADGASSLAAPEVAVPESLASDAGARGLGSVRLVIVAACAAAIAGGVVVVEGVRSRRIVIETTEDPIDARYSVLA